MTGCHLSLSWRRAPSWTGAVLTGTAATLLAIVPAPLVPIAEGYRAICERIPVLALLTNHAPPLPLALPLSLIAFALAVGSWAGMTRWIGTIRVNRLIARSATAPPDQLRQAGERLAVIGCLTYLAHPDPAAFCYGFLRPRIALTAGLVDRLDDAELAAVLAHERWHLRRRDPLRYLAIHALATSAFMFPAAPALRRRLETRIELAADRGALTVSPRGALAGAMMAVLAGSSSRTLGAVGLTATEARIAHLAGRPELPVIPRGSVLASLGLLGAIVFAMVGLNTSADLVRMVCAFCTGAS